MIAAELETLGKMATKALHKKEGAPATASPTARDAQAAGQPLAPELREEQQHLLEAEHGLACQHGVAGACAACQAARTTAGSGA
ncbi:hypothetical protein C2E21_4681 [Chlorella sorokiniana]|uniref:Uncharacterized protein n=1 Tax=Chlorella sorokiniana TaxID=3076 RepID=A0A2P6TQY7_CHLSO|nr:hypothetical protein C2E21_4681 [Chlorella sorokiniana]|eukprot:PRW56482.1 hypothetical protein C2E21_4681 [Chlorella sorokiniana]